MSTRKHPSGCQKRKRMSEVEKLIESQRGAMDKFVVSIRNPGCENGDIQVENPQQAGDLFSNAQHENPREEEQKEEPGDLLAEGVPIVVNNNIENYSNPGSIDSEEEYWKELLKRLVAVVHLIAKNGLALSTTDEWSTDEDDDPVVIRRFSTLIEMIAEFDPIMQEHFRRVENSELLDCYLGHELEKTTVHMLACEIKTRIVAKVKEAKYFSVVLDCNSDANYERQVSVTLRLVDVSVAPVKIEEFFLGFLDLDDTPDRCILDELVRLIESLGLDMNDMRGQGYAGGLSMEGEKEGLQRRLLERNPRAFYTPCGYHSLSLVLSDVVKYCPRSHLFGAMQTIYSIFSSSAQRWEVLTDRVKCLIVEPLPETTRWESCIECVEAIKSHPIEIRDALLELAETDKDSLIQSQAKSLATYAMDNFEFLLAMTIWYEILFTVSSSCKSLQSEDLLSDSTAPQLQGVVSFLEKFRVNGFESIVDPTKELALEMDVDPIFQEKQVSRRTKDVDEIKNKDVVALSCEESFKVEVFLYLVDQTISSIKTRLELLGNFDKTFGFLLHIGSLKSLDDKVLKEHCANLENSLTHILISDIDASALYSELQALRRILPAEVDKPIDVLNYLKATVSYPNACICYRILLTAPLIVASSDGNFSKIEMIKTYLRSDLSKECSIDWAVLSIEEDMLEKIKHEELVSSFAPTSARELQD